MAGKTAFTKTNQITHMKPIYKKVPTVVPVCPKCKVKLSGNNSMVLPWTCNCGEWKSNHYPFDGEYEIIPVSNID